MFFASSFAFSALHLFFLATWICFGRADELSTDYKSYNIKASFGPFPHHSHVSTGSTSPLLQVNTWAPDRMSKAESHIFIRNNGNRNKEYGIGRDATPVILSAEDLSAVYVDRRFPAVFDARVQQDRGQNYLTFFGGPCLAVGLGNGTSYVFDTSYREVYTVTAQNLTVWADLHEFELTGHGTAILTAYDLIELDLSTVDGNRGREKVRDSLFQEIDLETNEVVFQWRASDHIPLSHSFMGIGEGWDFFHLNSVEKTKDGNYLLSARHVNAIYLISGTSGEVIWTLGGRGNQFAELPWAGDKPLSDSVLSMQWQHHARFYPGTNETEITFFDNHALHHAVECKEQRSRALHIRIDVSNPERKTVQMLHEYLHPHGLRSGTQGSVQILENGNVFVGWGGNPSFSEHTIDGECILDVQFSPWRSKATKDRALDNYRAYRQPWKATPYWGPAIATRSVSGVVTAYLSWNGATEVRSWVLLASDNEMDLYKITNPLARVPRGGFETTIPLGHTNVRYLRAAALDINQQIIGSTGIYDVPNGKVTEVKAPISDPDPPRSDTTEAKPSNSTFEAFRIRPEASYSWPFLLFWFVMGVVLWYRRKDVTAAYRHVFHGRRRSVVSVGISPLE